ncbi:MAG: HNH endonuclease [bacterium]|nr:HNH endonuclease [bacterium]
MRRRERELKVASMYYSKIDVNYNLCLYCGLSGDTIDHVPPVSRAATHKGSFYEVPACRLCNSMLGAVDIPKINKRAEYLLEKYRARYEYILSMPDWQNWELEEMGPIMTTEIQEDIKKKQGIKRIIDNLEMVSIMYDY